MNKGITLDPESIQNLSVDMHCNIDFVGLWDYKDHQDPSCVKSCTRYVIFIANFPLLCVSHLQDNVAI